MSAAEHPTPAGGGVADTAASLAIGPQPGGCGFSRDGVSDADIMAQSEAIRREVEAEQPLVGEEESPQVLLAQYADNPAFLPKLAHFGGLYRAIRRSRGDGSCFYRAFLVCVGEHFVGRVTAPNAAGGSVAANPGTSELQKTYERLLAYVGGSCELLLALGYPDVTLPDFHEALLGYLEGLAAPGATAEGAVYAVFRDYMRGSYIITYLRCLTSLELLAKEDDYFPYICALAPHCPTVKHFCDSEVEAVNTDADQLQIMALTNGWGIGVTIAYLDATPGDKCQVLTFPESATGGGIDGGCDGVGASSRAFPPVVRLLYRPGHYDIAYPKA
jgi:ubiquitin thioesterase protein OTUB1